MTFVRDKIVRKNMFGDTLLLPDGYGKEEFINTLIWMTKYIQKYIYAYIYINRIRGMEMKCLWMLKFDGHNKDNTHMHTYIIR